MLVPTSYRAAPCGLAHRKGEGLWILKPDLPCTQISILLLKRSLGETTARERISQTAYHHAQPKVVSTSEDVGYLMAIFWLNNENIHNPAFHNPSFLGSLMTPLVWLCKPTLQMLLTWFAVPLWYFTGTSIRNGNSQGCGNSHKLPGAYSRAMKYSCCDFLKNCYLWPANLHPKEGHALSVVWEVSGSISWLHCFQPLTLLGI